MTATTQPPFLPPLAEVVSAKAARLLSQLVMRIARDVRSGDYVPHVGRALVEQRDAVAPLAEYIASLEARRDA